MIPAADESHSNVAVSGWQLQPEMLNAQQLDMLQAANKSCHTCALQADTMATSSMVMGAVLLLQLLLHPQVMTCEHDNAYLYSSMYSIMDRSPASTAHLPGVAICHHLCLPTLWS